MDYYLEIMRHFVATYGLVAVFLLGIAEEVIIFIPSSIIFIALGFLLIGAKSVPAYAIAIAVFKIALPGALGVTLGSLIFYWLVYWGGKPIVKKFGRYFNIDWKQIEALNRRFASGYVDEVALFVLRALPILPVSVVTVFCGLIRLGWKEFLATTFFGTLFRITGLSLLGWYLGREYAKYAVQIANFEKYFFVALLVAVVVGLFYYHGKQKKVD